MKRNQKGFTLMEMLIVVAIIAVLVAVAIPVYTSQMHKVRVAADWANVRAYYAEIQADYMTNDYSKNFEKTMKYNPNVPDVHKDKYVYDQTVIKFLNGTEVKLQAGIYWITHLDTGGYSIHYTCNANHPDCDLTLG